MKVAKFAITVLALTYGSAAIAENLVWYSEDNDGRVYYYDSDTIRRNNIGRIIVWAVSDATNDKTVLWRTKKVLNHIDCDEMTIGVSAFAEYSANGTLLDSGSRGYPDMRPAVPGSVGYPRLITSQSCHSG